MTRQMDRDTLKAGAKLHKSPQAAATRRATLHDQVADLIQQAAKDTATGIVGSKKVSKTVADYAAGPMTRMNRARRIKVMRAAEEVTRDLDDARAKAAYDLLKASAVKVAQLNTKRKIKASALKL